MTRSEKVAKARELRDQGLAYYEIGDALGVGQATAYRWLNPDYAERDRQKARAYKQANADRVREYDRQYGREHRGTCDTCGGSMGIHTGDGMCRACIARAADEKARRVEALWLAGKTMPEICAAMGWSKNMLSKSLAIYRAQGYNLPYRYRLRDPAFPEQVAA